MKSSKNLIEQLKLLPHFTKETINQIGRQFGLKKSTVETYISRFLKRKEIIQFKNGFYVSADFFSKNKSDISYSFYLANILRTPSYVSSWTALQYYNLATESIHTITSISPKITRSYETGAGNFSYQSIQGNLFSHFSLVNGRFSFFIATPSKALFDLLYFKTRQFRGMRFDEMKRLIDELRINIEEMEKKEQVVFYAMVKKYLNHYE